MANVPPFVVDEVANDVVHVLAQEILIAHTNPHIE